MLGVFTERGGDVGDHGAFGSADGAMQAKQTAGDFGDVDTQVDELAFLKILTGFAAMQDIAKHLAARLKEGSGRAGTQQRLTHDPRPAALGDFPQLQHMQDAAALATADFTVGPRHLDERQDVQHAGRLAIEAESHQPFGEVTAW